MAMPLKCVTQAPTPHMHGTQHLFHMGPVFPLPSSPFTTQQKAGWGNKSLHVQLWTWGS